MAFLFPFFLENRVLRVFLAFRCMPRGYVSLLNYNNKGLQWCGCSPFVKIWLIGKESCCLCLCRGKCICAACFSVYRGRVAPGIS